MSEREQAHAQVAEAAPVRGAPARLLQRKCACGGAAGLTGGCAECDKKRLLSRRGSAKQEGPFDVPPVVREVLRAPGRPLDPTARALFESRFRHDFGRVRVHADARAAESARAVGASAYTVGRDVVFGAGLYDPASPAGRRLLAHELTHVVQQNERAPAPETGELVVGRHDDAREAEADRAEAAGGAPHAHTAPRAAAGVLQRKAEGAQPETSFEGCDETLQNDIRSKHQPAIDHVNRAVASLEPGWALMDPADKAAFNQYFDPSNTGDIDDGFVRDVRANFLRIGSYMRSLRFDCDPSSQTLCGTSSRLCAGGRLMWTCFGNLHVCADNYPGAEEQRKIRTIIHESAHNALLTTDRAYGNRPDEFSGLAPRGSGVLGRALNVLGQIPVLGLLFRALPGNNDTINNPDSYAYYAMHS